MQRAAGSNTKVRATRIAVLLGFSNFLFAAVVSAAPCELADNGSGTVNLPPAGCNYIGDPSGTSDKYVITNGLPPGSTIELVPVHKDWICGELSVGACSVPVSPGFCEAAGGTLGGEGACADFTLELQVSGTGLLAGFRRIVSVVAFWDAQSGPRNPGRATQSFATELIVLEGQGFGDPDFAVLRFRAGSSFGLPSPGHTTLTRLGPPGSPFNVDSFFDISYEIDFQGQPGSVLEGMEGTTAGALRIHTGEPLSIAPSVPAGSTLSTIAVAGALLIAGAACLRRRPAVLF